MKQDWIRPSFSTERGRSVGVVVLVGFLVLSTAGVAVNTSRATTPSQGTPCHDPISDIPLGHGYSTPASEAAVNTTVDRVNASMVRFTYHDLDENEPNFGPSFPTWLYELGVRVASAEGFHVDRSPIGASLVWNTSVATPSVTVTTNDNRAEGGIDGAGAAIQPTWAFLPIPNHSHPTNVTLSSGQSGYVGDQVFLLGEYTVHSRSVGCHDIELFLPDALNSTESPTAIADSLEATARNLDVGWRYKTVRVYGVGNPVRAGGRAFTHEVWVNVDSEFAPPIPQGVAYPPRHVATNVWVHEYVHTRERWTTNSSVSIEASWLTEGMASYYMVAETERQGRMQAYDELRYWERLNRSLRAGNQRMTLTNRDSYRDLRGDYTRGAYVLASLDDELRARTFGLGSLDDVFYRLNQQEEVNHSSFRRAVIEVGGEEMGPWVDRYVAGSDVPPAPRPPLEAYIERLPHQRDLQVAAAAVVIFVLGIITMITWKHRQPE